MYKAIVFDIGRTLIGYNKPLNWSGLYRPAWEHIANKMGYNFKEDDYQHIIGVLTKYNTRINPREYEVTSTQIFTEILNGIGVSVKDLEQVKHCFYSYFRRDSFVYPEVEETLKELVNRGIVLATLSDVAYGMDNQYVLDDISTLQKYINYPYTSNDVGYRKPNIGGLKILAEKININMSEMIFVGDEEKDMLCANNAGAYSVLINRDGITKKYGQARELHSLDELLNNV